MHHPWCLRSDFCLLLMLRRNRGETSLARNLLLMAGGGGLGGYSEVNKIEICVKVFEREEERRKRERR